MEEKIIQMIHGAFAKNPISCMELLHMMTHYNKSHMIDPKSVGKLVDVLTGIFQIQLTPTRRKNVISWIIGQKIDPGSIRQICSSFLQAILSTRSDN